MPNRKNLIEEVDWRHVWLRRVLIDRGKPPPTSEKDSDPTLQGHARSQAGGLRQKTTFAHPINYSGRGTAILEECEMSHPGRLVANRLKLAEYLHRAAECRDLARTTASPSHRCRENGPRLGKPCGAAKAAIEPQG